MAHSGTQISKVASDTGEPKASPGRRFVDNHPSVLAARDLIQEARQHVARSHQLVERGRKLREKAEETMQAFRKHQTSL